MRRLSLLVLACLFLIPALLAFAQEATPDPSDSLSRALNAAERAEAAAQDARNFADLTMGMFSLFEGATAILGLVLPLLVIVGGIIGLRRLESAQNELGEARRRMEQELAEARQRFEQEMVTRRAELDSLREHLQRSADEQLATVREQMQHSAEKQHAESERATLALSLLPLGERQYRAADFGGALDTYRRALELDSNNPVIHYRLGYTYTQTGSLEQAEEHLTQALAIDPQFPLALAALGYVYRRIAEKMPEDNIQRGIMLAKAEELLRQGLALSPRLVDDDGESWWGSLGGLHRRRGQVDDAIAAYKRAAEVTPLSSYPYSNLALLYLYKGDKEAMLQTYQRVERLASREVLAEVENYWAYADLLTTRLALGKTQAAAEALDALFASVPPETPYALESLLSTLRQLAQVLDEEKAANIQHVIEQIQARQTA